MLSPNSTAVRSKQAKTSSTSSPSSSDWQFTASTVPPSSNSFATSSSLAASTRRSESGSSKSLLTLRWKTRSFSRRRSSAKPLNQNGSARRPEAINQTLYFIKTATKITAALDTTGRLRPTDVARSRAGDLSHDNLTTGQIATSAATHAIHVIDALLADTSAANAAYKATSSKCANPTKIVTINHRTPHLRITATSIATTKCSTLYASTNNALNATTSEY